METGGVGEWGSWWLFLDGWGQMKRGIESQAICGLSPCARRSHHRTILFASHEVDVSFALWMRKRGLGEVKELTQGHLAIRWQRRDSNSGL